MNAKNLFSKNIVLLIFLGTSLLSSAQDRIFTYTYQSIVLNKGQRELEVWNTLRTGRDDFYARLDNRTEFEIGLGKSLQTAFYLNLTSKTKTVEDLGVKSISTENEISFSNEFKLKLMDPVANPFGLALYGEYGIGTNELELEGKLILDKKFNNLTVATNVVLETEFAPEYVNNKLNWVKENKLEYYLSFGYSLNPKLNLTLESAFKNVYVDKELEHSALFSGLGFSYINDNFWVNFTVMPQLLSLKGETNSLLNLNEYEKFQIRLLFSYAF
ncbi:MAG: hypothetical protein HOO91_19130 [Bacteroidales bacterium]|nr:hypothetical protein [Bacteroidales bacterium]